jgi:hypothetical protein
MGQTANLAINPSLLPSMPFNAKTDLLAVALVASQPVVLVVPTDSPWKSLHDLIAAAKAQPGAIKQGLASTGTAGHLAGKCFLQGQDRCSTCPTKGAAPAVTDLLGKTHYMFGTPQAVYPMIKGQRCSALAVTSAKRLPSCPRSPPWPSPASRALKPWTGKIVAPETRPPRWRRRSTPRTPACRTCSAQTVAVRRQHTHGRQPSGCPGLSAKGAAGQLGRADPRREDHLE